MSGSALPVQETPAAEDEVEIMLKALTRTQDPLREAFVTRVLRAVTRLTEGLERPALKAAVVAPSDYAVLLEALNRAPALDRLEADDPLAGARLRGMRARVRLLQMEGGTLGAQQVAAVLGISRQAVDKRRKVGTLLGLERGRHGYAYPAWQFDHQGVIAGLADTLRCLQGKDPWMQLSFFLGGSEALDGATPLDALRRGAVEAVVRAATLFGEHGAA